MGRDLRARLHHAWFSLSRPLTLGVRGCVRDGEGRVLLVRHTYIAGWHMPGGGVERRETAMQALLRELEEEAGVRPEATPALHGVFSNHANHPNDHVLVYRVEAWTPCPATSRGEIAERGFFAPDALPEATTPATRRRIAEIVSGADLIEHW